jgi:hypothetical protein
MSVFVGCMLYFRAGQGDKSHDRSDNDDTDRIELTVSDEMDEVEEDQIYEMEQGGRFSSLTDLTNRLLAVSIDDRTSRGKWTIGRI